MKVLLEQGPYCGYFPKMDKYLFIAYLPAQEVATQWEFESDGLNLKLFGGSR